MDISDIQLLYDYNYWANGRILSATATVTPEQYTAPGGFPYGGLRGTLVHAYDAEQSWRFFFQQKTWTGATEFKEADVPTLDMLQARWRDEETVMRAYLAGLSDRDLSTHVHYTVDTGEKRDRILWHCLVHVVNHGTQHRSEAAALLTGFGCSPGDLDFTLFLNRREPAV